MANQDKSANGSTAVQERPVEPTTPVVTPPAVPEAPKPNRTGLYVVVAILAVVGLYFGVKSYQFNQTHASTDDAQVVADMVSISPQVTGTVEKVLVKDNQLVKSGDLLVTLDDRTFKAAVDQAQANLDAAIAQADGAGVSVDLTSQTGDAQISQAVGQVAQAQSGIASAVSDVAKSSAGIASAAASQQTAIANIASARSGITSAQAARARAIANETAAKAVVESARAQVLAADAQVVTAQANNDLAQKEVERYNSLAKAGAVSQQAADQRVATAQSAVANLEGARQQAAAARANLAQKQADLVSAHTAVTSADAAIQQAQASLRVMLSQREASNAGFRSAEAEQAAARESVRAAQARAASAEGMLAQAKTSGTQVSVSKTAKLQAIAKVEQARAALAEAKLQLSYCKIFAPHDGRVTKKNVDPGNLVQAGADLMAIVNEADVWVVADFKETQMPGVTVGKKVEIEVDAVPGIKYHGAIESIQAGTGSAFTLLPPDNASGNFTKVVQRIPVKILFDEGQADLDKLRYGMSATAIVTLK